jgi:hypothetical protein
MTCGHDVMLDRPEEPIPELLAVASRSAGRGGSRNWRYGFQG